MSYFDRRDPDQAVLFRGDVIGVIRHVGFGSYEGVATYLGEQIKVYAPTKKGAFSAICAAMNATTQRATRMEEVKCPA